MKDAASHVTIEPVVINATSEAKPVIIKRRRSVPALMHGTNRKAEGSNSNTKRPHASNGAVTARVSRRNSISALALTAILKRDLPIRRLKHKNSDSRSTSSNYDDMMERFQLRRIQRKNSQASSASGSVRTTYAMMDSTAHGVSISTAHDGDEKTESENLGAPSTGTSLPPPDRYRVRRGSYLDNRARVSLYWSLVCWRRLAIACLRHGVDHLTSPMSPTSATARVRHFVLLAVFLVNVIYFPLAITFLRDAYLGPMQAVTVVSELAFLLDFVLMFNTAFYNANGLLNTDRRTIAMHYLKTWMFLDMWSSIPVDSMSLLLSNTEDDEGYAVDVVLDTAFRAIRFVHMLRFGRVLWIARVVRSGKSIWAWLLYSRYSHLVRICGIMSLTMLIAHYVACGWHVLDNDGMTDEVTLVMYMRHYYDALQLLQGQSLPTTTLEQNAFASVAVLGGSVLLALVFGHVAVLVANFNANSTCYQRKMEALFARASKLQLPPALRERIHMYYDHLWHEYESLDGDIVRFSKELSHTLELEVVLCKYMQLIMNVPFWRNCSPDFQKQLALHMSVRVYLPDDFIIRRDEVGDELYMINRGVCEMHTGPDSFERPTPSMAASLSTDNLQEAAKSRRSVASDHEGLNEIAATDDYAQSSRPFTVQPSRTRSKYVLKLHRGQAFGEIALFMNYPRTALVRAVSYVEMCVLKRQDFQQILTRYPDDRRQVMSSMLSHCMINNELNDVFCPLKQVVRSVFAGEDPDLAERITAQYASELISQVINPELEDDSIKFGVTRKLQQQLTELHDVLHAQQETTAVKGTESPTAHATDNSDNQDSREHGDHRPSTSAPIEGLSVYTDARLKRIETNHREILRLLRALTQHSGHTQLVHTTSPSQKQSTQAPTEKQLADPSSPSNQIVGR